MIKQIKAMRALFLLLIATALATTAEAAVITNGGFESGLAGWTRADQSGSEGTFAIQSGTLSPVTGTVVPAPAGGTNAAMTDAEGPGSHVLYQMFTITAPVAPTLLVFDLFVGNRADAFFTPGSLDFATPTLNQQARVDILTGGANPFSVSGTDVLLNAFQTTTASPLVSGYNHYAVDITSVLNSHLNTPLMLRFAEADNVFMFQLGVDNVDFQPVPEPSTAAAALGGFALLLFLHRRRAGKT